MNDNDDNDEYIQAQLEAIAKYEKEQKEHQQRKDDLESAAIASAIASSEYEYEQSLEAKSEQLAKNIHQQEVSQYDYEYAKLLADETTTTYHDHDHILQQHYQEEQQQEELQQLELQRQLQQEQQRQQQQQQRQQQQQQRRRQQEEAQHDHELAIAIETSEKLAEAQHVAQSMTNATLSYEQERMEERNAGGWDCIVCTYRNEPYQNKCTMCQTDAPKHVLSFCPISPLRFGLEIEIIIPNGKQLFTHKSLAKSLTLLGPPKVVFMGYSHEQTTNNVWKMVTDSSIQGPNGDDQDLCLELVSPILHGDNGLIQLRTLLENIRKVGVETNASCGFHVHVDASTREHQKVPEMGTTKGLIRVAQCFLALENAFDLLVSRTWEYHSPKNNNSGRSNYTDRHYLERRTTNRNRYCRSNRLDFGELSNRQRWDKLATATTRTELCHIIHPTNDRYRKLNLTNIPRSDRPSTIEFRHHGGVYELIEAECWVRLILRFCYHSCLYKPESYKCLLPEQSTTPKQELIALFNLIKCNGLEQFFVTDRRLFVDEHILRNIWQCYRCKRRFDTSRSLAQHVDATGH